MVNECCQIAWLFDDLHSSAVGLDWVLSHWAISLCLDSFLYCVLLCVVCMIA